MRLSIVYIRLCIKIKCPYFGISILVNKARSEAVWIARYLSSGGSEIQLDAILEQIRLNEGIRIERRQWEYSQKNQFAKPTATRPLFHSARSFWGYHVVVYSDSAVSVERPPSRFEGVQRR